MKRKKLGIAASAQQVGVIGGNISDGGGKAFTRPIWP
jgi:hypothetical protein